MTINDRKTNNKKRKSKKKITKTIGEKLGEGSFGCVVTPPIKCKKKSKKVELLDLNNNKYVSKLINAYDEDEKDELKREIKINKLVYKIDPDNVFFVSFIKTCPIKIKSLKYRKDIYYMKQNTKLLGKSQDDNLCYVNKLTKNIIMMNAGVNLTDVISYHIYHTMRALIKLEIKNIFKHLLKGLKILHSNGIAHLDIKLDNISFSVSNDGIYHVRLLDFGFSEKENKKSQHIIHSYPFGTTGYMAPDMYVLCKLREYGDYVKLKDLHINSNKIYIVNKIHQSIKSNELKYHNDISLFKINVVNNSKKNLDKDLDNYFNTNHHNSNIKKEYIINKNDIKKIYNNLVNEMGERKLKGKFSNKINGYKYKYDIYALGISFHIMINELKIKDDKLTRLVMHMVEPIPDKRYDAEQCLRYMNLIDK